MCLVRQRFQTVVEQGSYSPIEVGVLVQSFEFTFELGLKTIKNYLYEQGIETQYPRQTLKEGFNLQLIEDGHTWIHMLEKRNELSHTNNQEVAHHAVKY